jgi:hypothetical protein
MFLSRQISTYKGPAACMSSYQIYTHVLSIPFSKSTLISLHPEAVLHLFGISKMLVTSEDITCVAIGIIMVLLGLFLEFVKKERVKLEHTGARPLHTV